VRKIPHLADLLRTDVWEVRVLGHPVIAVGFRAQVALQYGDFLTKFEDLR